MSENRRKRELELGPVGPWKARITVDAVETNHGRRTIMPHDHIFEVVASWIGPPMIGLPPSREPVHSRDVCACETLEHAIRTARAAEDAFRAGGDYPPDLRELAGILGTR